MTRNGLKFALVTTFYPPYHFGGDAIYVRNQAQALAKRGHSVDVIHTADAYLALGGDNIHNPAQEPAGIRVFRLQSRFPRLSSLATQQTGVPVFHQKKINTIFQKESYDVIHYHNISLVGGPAILRYGHAVKLYTAHEHWLVCPTHILWRHNREICTKKSCIRCGLYYRRPPQLWRYTRLLDKCAENIDEFLALSKFSASAHRKFGFKRSFRLLPSTVPISFHNSNRDGSSSKQPYFLFVGRLETIKGLQDIIPVFRKGVTADLYIAGAGKMESELKGLAEGAPNIRFLGKVEPEHLSALYRDATAVIIPSKCIEVFPLVALEAFREGTPVITSNHGPFPDLINDSGAGSTFENGTQLAQLLTELLTDKHLLQSQKTAAIAAFNKNWTESAVYKQYFSIIREIAQRKKQQHTMAILNSCSDEGYLNHTANSLASMR